MTQTDNGDNEQAYDQRGWLHPGTTVVVNATGHPEFVRWPEEMSQ